MSLFHSSVRSQQSPKSLVCFLFCKVGVTITTNAVGDGDHYPEKGANLEIHYEAFLEDGTKFDSSIDRGCPFKFQIGAGTVIRGMDEGVMKMSLGEKATLDITPDFGYGAQGAGDVVPANATMRFEVELVSIN